MASSAFRGIVVCEEGGVLLKVALVMLKTLAELTSPRSRYLHERATKSVIQVVGWTEKGGGRMN